MMGTRDPSGVKYSWFELLQKNKPQGNAVAAGLLLTLVSGLHIGWGIFNLYLPFISIQSIFTINGFYIGAMIGAIIAQFWLKNGNKRHIYGCANILCIGSCVIFVANAQDFYSLLISRILGGTAHGLIYVTVIVHASEVLVKELRGTIISAINVLTKISIFTASIIISSVNSDPIVNIVDVKLVFGIGLGYAVMAAIFIFVLFQESPYLLIKQGREGEALSTMIKLRNESSETMEIRNDIHEIKAMIEEDDKLSSSIIADNNTRPLMIVTASSFVNVLSFNFMFNIIRLLLTRQYLETLQVSELVLVVLYATVGLVPLLAFDKFRRRSYQMFGWGAGAVLIISGIVQLTMTDTTIAQIVVFSIYEVICALGFGATPDVLCSEAYPLTKKVNSIAFKVHFESVLHIIFISATYRGQIVTHTYSVSVLMVTGFLIIAISAYVWRIMPETKGKSLREARQMFRK